MTTTQMTAALATTTSLCVTATCRAPFPFCIILPTSHCTNHIKRSTNLSSSRAPLRCWGAWASWPGPFASSWAAFDCVHYEQRLLVPLIVPPRRALGGLAGWSFEIDFSLARHSTLY
ncbi:unnamed protein product [Heterosigma akashiwo]